MPNGEKYIVLTTYLENCGQDVISLSFEQIEKIVGFQLPSSAYKYQAFWSNSTSYANACAWLVAGYKSRNLNLTAQTIELYRSGDDGNGL